VEETAPTPLEDLYNHAYNRNKKLLIYNSKYQCIIEMKYYERGHYVREVTYTIFFYYVKYYSHQSFNKIFIFFMITLL
jgi:hypothetical protein